MDLTRNHTLPRPTPHSTNQVIHVHTFHELRVPTGILNTGISVLDLFLPRSHFNQLKYSICSHRWTRFDSTVSRHVDKLFPSNADARPNHALWAIKIFHYISHPAIPEMVASRQATKRVLLFEICSVRRYLTILSQKSTNWNTHFPFSIRLFSKW